MRTPIPAFVVSDYERPAMNEEQIASLLAPYEAHLRALTVQLYNANEMLRGSKTAHEELQAELQRAKERIAELEEEE